MEDRRKTLLLVEDEAIIALAKEKQLQNEGYDVVIATNGEKAIDLALSNKPPVDLILMDIDLGKGIDGTQAAAEILSKRDIPVVFLSSHTEREVVEKTEKITSYGYVVKNSSITVLSASIKMAFKLFEAHKKINEQNMAIKAGNENLRVTIEKLEKTNNSLFQAQNQLRVNEDRYKKGQEIGKLGSWEYDIKTNLIWGSDEAKRIYNLPLSVETLTLEEVEVMDKDKDRMKQALLDLIRKESIYNLEFEIYPRGGSESKWIHSIAELKKDAQGNPVKVVGVIQDITDRKKAEEEVARSEESLSITLQSIGDGVIASDIEGKITRMNKVAEKLTGWTFAEAKDKPLKEIFKIVNSETGIPVENPVIKVIESGSIVGLANHTVLISRNKDEYQIADSAAPIRDKDGKVQGVILVFSDVTGKYEAEKRIESLARFPQEDPNPVLRVDTKGHILYSNPASIEIVDELKKNAGQHFSNEFNILIGNVFSSNKRVVDKELVLNNKKIFNFTFNPIRDMGYINVYAQDISTRKHEEEEKQRMEKLFQAMFNAIPDAVIIADTQRNIQLANAGLKNTFGYEPEEVVGKSTEILYSGESEYKRTGTTVFNKDSLQKEKRYSIHYKDKFGNKFVGETIGAKLYDNNGVWIGNLGIMRNISEQMRLMKELSAAKRRAEESEKEKGLLLKEVHHRIKNNMSSIGGLLAIQANSLKNKEARAVLQEAESRITSMMILYDKLYKSDDLNNISISDYLPALIKETLCNLSLPGTKITTQLNLDDIVLDAKRMSLVGIIVNELVTNTIKYAFTDTKSGILAVDATCKHDRVQISVSDDGKGIPDSVNFKDSDTSGFGFKLVYLLTTQLNGRVKIERDRRTRIILEFDR